MDDAGGLFAARASAAFAAVPPLEAYSREDLAAVLAEAADRQADLQEAIDEARLAALQPPVPLDVVPRAHADDALRAAEDRLAALEAELAEAQARLAEAQHAQVHLVPLEVPAAVAAPGVLTWPVAPPRVAPAPVTPALVAPVVVTPVVAPVVTPVAAPAPPPVEVADAPTVAVPVVPAEVAPRPVAAPAPVAPQVVLAREPFARATGLLQVVTWSIVVAVVLIVLLAWFA